MPTGYTAKLCEQDVSFQEFALTCARAMGACILMRDEPLDTPIPEVFEESAYHDKALNDARAKLQSLLDMGEFQARCFGSEEKAQVITRLKEGMAKAQAQDARLNGMLAKVNAWEPPTREHDGLKKFMVEQLTISLDGDGYYRDELAKAEAMTPQEYFSKAVESARWSVNYHIKEEAEERERNKGRNDWVRKLRESLKD